MIRIDNLSLAYRGGKRILTRGNATVPAGTLCALIGRNGSGKSTLLRAMCGTDRPESGRILIGGSDVTAARPAELARLLAIVTTERIRVARLTCRDVVALGRAPFTGGFGRLSAHDHKAVQQAMELTGCAAFASRAIATLSDGESQRVMLARALAQDTPVILLDEPTSFLDVPSRLGITALLASLAHQQGKTIVYSTHELELAYDRSDSVMLLDSGALLHLPAAEMRQYMQEHPWL